MELWFFYAIIGSVTIGINSYLIKILADKKIDGAIVAFAQGSAYFVIGGVQTILFDHHFSSIFSLHPAVLYSIAIAVVIFLNLRFRMIALRYLSSSEYYIGYRIILTVLLALIGIAFLGESITELQIFGLILGSFAVLFLFEEDVKLRHSRNWSRAILFFGMSIIAGVGIQILGKMQGISDFPFSLLLFMQGITMLGLTLFFDRQVVFHTFSSSRLTRNEYFTLIAATVLVYISAICNLSAYLAGGSVSLVTKIYAYSLFIPIFLAIIFSKEKITYKKVIALFLTILSLYFLV